MRYRYITCGTAKISDKVCDFRLVSGVEFGRLSKYPMKTYYRINIPDDMTLIKYSCDGYSTTEDTRTLEELGCEFFMLDGYLKPEKLDIHISEDDLKTLEKEALRVYTRNLYAKSER